MKIGFLGPNGSFSHQVALSAFPKAELVPFVNITSVMKAYESGKVDYSIVPVENSIEGSVHETIDYLYHKADLTVVAEFVLPIKQQLLGHVNQTSVKKVFSHPQAIAQGKQFIEEHYPQAQIEVTASTAAAARYVSQHPNQDYAAIAPVAAAEEYGLRILAKNIQEIAENETRFWLLGKEKHAFSLSNKGRKSSLAITLPDNKPGALYQALAVFAWRGIDLTKIESRPLKTALGEYFFIIDINSQQAEKVSFAFEELSTMEIVFKVLGNYDVYNIK